MKQISNCIFLIAKDYRTMTWGAVFQEIRPGAGLKTGDFVEKRLGRATVE